MAYIGMVYIDKIGNLLKLMSGISFLGSFCT